MNRTWLTVYHIKNKMEHTVIVKGNQLDKIMKMPHVYVGV